MQLSDTGFPAVLDELQTVHNIPREERELHFLEHSGNFLCHLPFASECSPQLDEKR